MLHIETKINEHLNKIDHIYNTKTTTAYIKSILQLNQKAETYTKQRFNNPITITRLSTIYPNIDIQQHLTTKNQQQHLINDTKRRKRYLADHPETNRIRKVLLQNNLSHGLLSKPTGIYSHLTKKMYIQIPPKKRNSNKHSRTDLTTTHETTHFIDDLGENKNLSDLFHKINQYYHTWKPAELALHGITEQAYKYRTKNSEIYARIMEVRYILNMKPGDTIQSNEAAKLEEDYRRRNGDLGLFLFLRGKNRHQKLAELINELP